MIDITRNIVVTAENVEEVLRQLKKQLRNRCSSVEFMKSLSRKEREHQGFPLTTQMLLQNNLKTQNLINRIELIKGDLGKDSMSRFHTMPEDKFRCEDCAAFGFRTMWNDKNGYWLLPDGVDKITIPVIVSLNI